MHVSELSCWELIVDGRNEDAELGFKDANFGLVYESRMKTVGVWVLIASKRRGDGCFLYLKDDTDSSQYVDVIKSRRSCSPPDMAGGSLTQTSANQERESSWDSSREGLLITTAMANL